MNRLIALCLAAACAAPALAQTPEWPQAKPITYVVPFTAGGSTDVVGRTLAEKLQAGAEADGGGRQQARPGRRASAPPSWPRPHPTATRCSAAPSARMPSTPACTRTSATTR